MPPCKIVDHPVCQQMSTIRGRIDIHHHFFPSSAEKLKKNAEMGWRTPPENLPWTPETSLRFMDATQIDMAFLSLPPTCGGKTGPENRRSARRHNEYAAAICQKYPCRFGFFASLPFLDDVEGESRPRIHHTECQNRDASGALSEITYAFDQLNADGIALASQCGEGDNASQFLFPSSSTRS